MTHAIAGDDEGVGGGEEADLAADRERSVWMVAGHHHDADAGAAAAFDRRRHFRSRRILEADQSVEHEVFFEARAIVAIGELAVGESEDPQAFLGHRRLCGDERRRLG